MPLREEVLHPTALSPESKGQQTGLARGAGFLDSWTASPSQALGQLLKGWNDFSLSKDHPGVSSDLFFGHRINVIFKIEPNTSLIPKHRCVYYIILCERNIQKAVQKEYPENLCLLPLRNFTQFPRCPEQSRACAPHSHSHHRVNAYFRGLAHVQSKTWLSACCLLKLGKKHLQHYKKHIVKGNTCKLNLLSYE